MCASLQLTSSLRYLLHSAPSQLDAIMATCGDQTGSANIVYIYEHLDDNDFRFLELQPGSNTDDIVVRLSHYSLRTPSTRNVPPPYGAISYRIRGVTQAHIVFQSGYKQMDVYISRRIVVLAPCSVVFVKQMLRESSGFKLYVSISGCL